MKIEDLPPEMRDRARLCLSIYGTVFIYRNKAMDEPLLLDPEGMSMIVAKVPEHCYSVCDAHGNHVERPKFEEFKDGELQRKVLSDRLRGYAADLVLIDEHEFIGEEE
jgi:hypothetical protein